jgi:hypothetical protein
LVVYLSLWVLLFGMMMSHSRAISHAPMVAQATEGQVFAAALISLFKPLLVPNLSVDAKPQR